MRHRVKGKRLSRNKDHRKALFKNLITSLILHEEIKTTETKAKSVKGLVDRLMNWAKTGTLHSRRLLASFLPSQEAVAKMMDILGPRFRDRTSGFTRIIRLGRRKGDQTLMVKMELVERQEKESKKEREKKPKGKKLETAPKKQPQVVKKSLTLPPITKPSRPSLIKKPSVSGK
jgi:large subunit ribosomal protein L17